MLARGRGAGGVERGRRRGRAGEREQARVLGQLDEEAVRGDKLSFWVNVHEKRDVRDAGAERVELEAAAGGAGAVWVRVARDRRACEPCFRRDRRIDQREQLRGEGEQRLIERAQR